MRRRMISSPWISISAPERPIQRFLWLKLFGIFMWCWMSCAVGLPIISLMQLTFFPLKEELSSEHSEIHFRQRWLYWQDGFDRWQDLWFSIKFPYFSFAEFRKQMFIRDEIYCSMKYISCWWFKRGMQQNCHCHLESKVAFSSWFLGRMVKSFWWEN